jgi:hypothetical protein
LWQAYGPQNLSKINQTNQDSNANAPRQVAEKKIKDNGRISTPIREASSSNWISKCLAANRLILLLLPCKAKDVIRFLLKPIKPSGEFVFKLGFVVNLESHLMVASIEILYLEILRH